jgi:RNA polymerase sigma-70 factor (ECF subfamily)
MDRIEALWRRCRAGDPEALEELVRRWERKLFYYVRRLVADESDAWDVLQQTWVRVLGGYKRVRDPDALVPWLYRVARNTALTHRKSLLARERWVDHDAPVDGQPVADDAQSQWSAEDVHQAMDRLSPHHREALTLFFLEEFSIEAMAAVLDVSEGTVKSRLFYARRALRQAIEQTRSMT